MADNSRAARLKRLFFDVAHGRRLIGRSADGTLLLEAVCAQPNAVQCVTTILSQPPLLKAVRHSLNMDCSEKALNSRIALFFQYVSNADVRSLNGGQVLLDLEKAVLDPPLLWDAMKAASEKATLSTAGLQSFATLALDLLLLLQPTDPAFMRLDVASTCRALCTSLSRPSHLPLRFLGCKIEEALNRVTSGSVDFRSHSDFQPGGRHDNDFADFRKIAIFPTTMELLSKEQPFYQTTRSVFAQSAKRRVAAHLDNQFRLFREDFMAELREDINIATGSSKTGSKRWIALNKLRGLQLWGINAGASDFLKSPAIALRCWDTRFKNLPLDKEERLKHFKEERSFFRHGSLGCLLQRGQVVSFATVDRNETLLAQNPSILLLNIFGDSAIRNTLLMLKTTPAHDIEFVLVDTPFFAYEPVLEALQTMPSLPLADQLLGLENADVTGQSPLKLDQLAGRIESLARQDLRTLLNLSKSVSLDEVQTRSIIAGLTQAVSLVQGPPGTGKSFIGALLAKAFFQHTRENILVLCYTNHALDQFLEDIMDIGVNSDDMVRIGGKSTARTFSIRLSEKRKNFRAPQAAWHLRKYYTSVTEDAARELESQGSSFSRWKLSDIDILRRLEFSDSDTDFFSAFAVPYADDQMTVVAEGGKAVDNLYLINRWKRGKDAGIFRDIIQNEFPEVWNMDSKQRAEEYAQWASGATSEQVEALCLDLDDYGRKFDTWKQYRDGSSLETVKATRIIGCTTTAAAKYRSLIAGARPGIVLVEEAGEVLESHVLTALGSNTKQLVLIGDHLQLRPKVANYGLTVEKGEGFNLNMSLFERLVRNNHPHTVLSKQHRMRPEISSLVRRLMYPALIDAESTKGRDDVRGLQSNVIFVNHEQLEDVSDGSSTLTDGYKAVRRNRHEVRMILKVVRYLAQQGYGTDRQVILTPYLGQLRLLMDELKADHDPVLNDLDSHDLVKAGLLDPASGQVTKRPLRISTVDNYQGEESSIVIVSLTRSNAKGDIGFLSEPERLNVLLSRARDGLIVIGNAATFRASRKGKRTWIPFFDQLRESGHLFDGLPVRCERHRQRMIVLTSPEEFDRHAPNGGCNEPCQALLKCKQHRCPEKCHQLVDHSMVKCEHVVELKCSQDHKTALPCWKSAQPCPTCERLEQERKRRQARDLALAKKREALEQAYLSKLLDLDQQIEEQHSVVRDHREAAARAQKLEQKRDDLTQAKTAANDISQHSSAQSPVKSHAKSNEIPLPFPPIPTSQSNAGDDWERQKRVEGAQNQHIDALMRMIGLETVKAQVLNIKDKVDTALRQGTSLAKERFGTILLGNPGTGKTTVAHLYAKCLASMGVVPAAQVEETSASKLMNGGVSTFQKLLEKVLNAGGGTVFVDEAYQLAAENSGASGRQILDALLDASELQRGKVIFLLAGYKRQMENVLSYNPGLSSRFPHEFIFEDYTDEQLRDIFLQQVHACYNGRMAMAGGSDGLFVRIVARRVGYERGRPGFGNARAMENSFARIRSRQAKRLSAERRQGLSPDDLLLTQEDLIGHKPSTALTQCDAWIQLQELIGLSEVKDSVRALLKSITYNYERELREEPLLELNLNRVFLGSPGTGKTTVAKLYGQILRDIGVLSNGEVVVRNPADFVGAVLGESEKNTKGILAATTGKVLVIDEAYGLHCPSGGGSGQQMDPYKAAVIDTIVAEVQSVPGDDRCVLLLGYRPQMEAMFQSVNPGLTRRFPLSEAFEFADFSEDDLSAVVELKLKQQGYTVTEVGFKAIMEHLARARNKPNFGNAGEVDILLKAAQARHLKRQTLSAHTRHSTLLEANDIDPDFDRGEKGRLSVKNLFQDTVGAENVIKEMEKIQSVANRLRRRNLDPRETAPFNFLFVGPPGTGKTTTARKIGELYYDIGILGTKEVVEVSASELLGEYVAQTAPRTQKLLERCLGKVLFIDEAYRLAEGHFGKEALGEIVDRITKSEFHKRLIIVLAGYEEDMEHLLTINSGLPSRFPTTIRFHSLTSKDCWTLLLKRLQEKVFLSCTQLENLDMEDEKPILAKFAILARRTDWANARDIGSMVATIANAKLETEVMTDARIPIIPADIIEALDAAIAGKSSQQSSHKPAKPSDSVSKYMTNDACASRTADVPRLPVPVLDTSSYALHEAERFEEDPTNGDTEVSGTLHYDPKLQTEDRDADVSDEVWTTLESDKQKALESEKALLQLIERQTTLEEVSREDIVRDADEQRENEMSENSTSEDDAGRRQHERERIAAELLRRKRESQLENIRRERAEKERQRQQEIQNQQKLRKAGACPVGFRWIKQANGYRCAGGSHFISTSELESLS